MLTALPFPVCKSLQSHSCGETPRVPKVLRLRLGSPGDEAGGLRPGHTSPGRAQPSSHLAVRGDAALPVPRALCPSGWSLRSPAAHPVSRRQRRSALTKQLLDTARSTPCLIKLQGRSLLCGHEYTLGATWPLSKVLPHHKPCCFGLVPYPSAPLVFSPTKGA